MYAAISRWTREVKFCTSCPLVYLLTLVTLLTYSATAVATQPPKPLKNRIEELEQMSQSLVEVQGDTISVIERLTQEQRASSESLAATEAASQRVAIQVQEELARLRNELIALRAQVDQQKQALAKSLREPLVASRQRTAFQDRPRPLETSVVPRGVPVTKPAKSTTPAGELTGSWIVDYGQTFEVTSDLDSLTIVRGEGRGIVSASGTMKRQADGSYVGQIAVSLTQDAAQKVHFVSATCAPINRDLLAFRIALPTNNSIRSSVQPWVLLRQ